MSEQKFTPGPWEWSDRYESRDGDATFSLIGASGYGILSCDGLGNSPQNCNRFDAAIIAVAPELLSEVIAAHQIIRNALAVMTIEQKSEWARLNDADGVAGEGATRANEREAVIDKATWVTK